MKHSLSKAIVLAALIAAPTSSQAGWVSTWSNTSIKQNGDRTPASDASMSVSGGRVRVDQDDVITIIDYPSGRYTILNPTKNYFWNGTIDDYVREMSISRDGKMAEKYGEHLKGRKHKDRKAKGGAKEYKPPTVDLAKLPPLSVTKTETTEKIAGYDTVKYAINANGELFQEIWVAPIDMSADLNFDAFLAAQRKIGAARQGKSAEYYNALYVNDDYRKLLEKGFVLKAITHHIAGGFERKATSIQTADVPADQFTVPPDYRKVRLADVLNPPAAQETPAAAPAAPPKKKGS